MIKGLHHVGISVVNLDRSIEFYRDVLGMEVAGQVMRFEGERYEKIMAIEGARGRVALMRKGILQIELFEFAHPTTAAEVSSHQVCDGGISHFCVEVTDLDLLYERMRAKGVSFHCAPLDFFGKAKATYGRDPDGNVFEMLEMLT